jgi:hypothetical protein
MKQVPSRVFLTLPGHPRKELVMEDREELNRYLADVVGEEGCGGSCDQSSVFEDDEGWKMMLCQFMAPWYLGKTLEEAKASIDGYAKMGFGLAA